MFKKYVHFLAIMSRFMYFKNKKKAKNKHVENKSVITNYQTIMKCILRSLQSEDI